MNKIIGIYLFLILLVFIPSWLDAQIIYVDANSSGANNGTNWENAYTDLQDALTAATVGNQIWVAMGVYKPVGPADPDNVTGEERDAVFQLVNEVPMYGGFSGTESELNERDWENNLTILSGDIDNNDTTTPDGIIISADDVNGTNSYRLVMAENVNHNTVLDGFVITGAQSLNEENQNTELGGGMSIADSNPTLSNLMIIGNSARHGGGMHLSGSSPIITNVELFNNWADLFGGGMTSVNTGKPELNNVIFQSNAVGPNGTGGGMAVNFSDAILNDVTFLNNSAFASGGGFRTSNSSPELTNVTFRGNSASQGGGFYTIDSSPLITDALFEINSAGDRGGGLYSLRSRFTLNEAIFEGNISENTGGGAYIAAGRVHIATLQNIYFRDNEAENGAGMEIVASSPVLSNLIFHNNIAGNIGGGISFSSLGDDNDPVLYNLIFYANDAGFGGGAVSNIGNSAPEFFNSIFWGNTSPNGNEIWNSSNSSTTLHYNIYSNASGDIVAGEGFTALNSHTSNPQFVDFVKGNFRVQPGSPAINNGDPDTELSPFPVDNLENPVDFGGKPRFQGQAIDIGVFESDTRSIQLTGVEGFRMISSPTVTTISELLSTVWTQGIENAEFEGGDPNIWIWDNTSIDDDVSNWKPVNDLNNILQAGDGILVYIFDQDEFGNLESAGFPKTLTVNGTVHSLPVLPAINPNPGGFTLIGNPSVSSIAWEDMIKNDLDDVIYVWDPNDEEWKASDGSIGELEKGIIRPFQSFLARTSDGAVNPTLEISTTTVPGQFYGKEEVNESYVLSLKLEGNKMKNSLWVRFSNRGGLQRHAGDGLKLKPFTRDFALLSALADDGSLLDIKHLPTELDKILQIPLAVETTRTGNYIITAENMSLPAGWAIFLRDEETGATIPVDEQLEYSFDISATSLKQVSGMIPKQFIQDGVDIFRAGNNEAGLIRFSLVIVPKGIVFTDSKPGIPDEFKLNQNYPNPFNPSTVISYEIPVNSEIRLDLFDITGRYVSTLANGQVSPGRHKLIFDAGNLSSGVYIYRLRAGGILLSRQLTLIK